MFFCLDIIVADCNAAYQSSTAVDVSYQGKQLFMLLIGLASSPAVNVLHQGLCNFSGESQFFRALLDSHGWKSYW